MIITKMKTFNIIFLPTKCLMSLPEKNVFSSIVVMKYCYLLLLLIKQYVIVPIFTSK